MRDERREREKYARASLAEQLGDELRALRGSRPLLALLAFLFGGWLILTVTTPEHLPADRLAAGDCLYVRSADADLDAAGGPLVGTPTGVVAALYGQGAERAGCDASHSHEVADAYRLPENLLAPYPGQGPLTTRETPRCEAAFEAYVGRPPAGSAFALTVAVPSERAWGRDVRAAACLVSAGDRHFLLVPARGSGR